MVNLILTLISYYCGYYAVQKIPIPESPFTFIDFLILAAFHPFDVFVGALCLLFGFLIQGYLIKWMIEYIYFLFINKTVGPFNIYYFTWMLSQAYLFKDGFWIPITLFFLSTMYGIISLDLKKKRIPTREKQ